MCLDSSVSACETDAWKLLELWRVGNALREVEANDAFLGLLCKGRWHVMQGDVDEAQRTWTEASYRAEAFFELPLGGSWLRML